jgi:hypothetical protein
MSKIFPDKDDITWGGFIKSNVENSVINDCLSSGDPENMFLAIQEAIENIQYEIIEMGEDKFWEKEMANWRRE